MGESGFSNSEIVQLSRLAMSGEEADVRLFLAKKVRKLRQTDAGFADELELLLKSKPTRSNGVLRDATTSSSFNIPKTSGDTAGLSLLKTPNGLEHHLEPMLEAQAKEAIEQVILERKFLGKLKEKNIRATRSLIFQGKPGVGKTMTAKWLAQKLELPLYILDLTAVMSSYLGKTGNNLRAAIDYAKTHPCVLLLDEIDAIAKKRSDEADVGELKRLVTVMLQELEDWTEEGLLIAATNHPELVDPALWRRFDMEITFEYPSEDAIEAVINRFLGEDVAAFANWLELLIRAFKGKSFSYIERAIMQLRRIMVLSNKEFEFHAFAYLFADFEQAALEEKIEVAVLLVSQVKLSQRKAQLITGVSRDTIRKRLNN